MIEPLLVSYRCDDVTLTGCLYDGARGRRVPGVLVAHEGAGLTAHSRGRAQRLAELGYVAFAIDLFGEADPPLERCKQLVAQLRDDRAKLRARAVAGLDVLVRQPRVDDERTAAIGFCFGGMAVLELARAGAALAAVVGFHADLTAGASSGRASFGGKVLVCAGDADPIVGADQRRAFADEMTAVGVDWQLHLHGGAGHSFTNPDIDAQGFPGFAYHADADRRSWLAMRVLFDEVFSDPGA